MRLGLLQPLDSFQRTEIETEIAAALRSRAAERGRPGGRGCSGRAVEYLAPLRRLLRAPCFGAGSGTQFRDCKTPRLGLCESFFGADRDFSTSNPLGRWCISTSSFCPEDYAMVSRWAAAHTLSCYFTTAPCVVNSKPYRPANCAEKRGLPTSKPATSRSRLMTLRNPTALYYLVTSLLISEPPNFLSDSKSCKTRSLEGASGTNLSDPANGVSALRAARVATSTC
ncbi:hypothetical protein EDC01DRAFT_136200 [Geopyxis carbonaria]|nr:hypothetical protein EDC01DRAFT_136200 [Geopyxis carbonaria]